MIKIAIADDHKLFAKGIEGLLAEEEDFQICGTFINGQELIDFLETKRVDVVLTDMNMPVMSGDGVISAIKSKYPRTKVIVLSMYDDETIFKKCQKLGANAYMLKDADPDELIYTIREVLDGSHVMSFQKVIQQNNDYYYYDSFRDKYKLSKRELQIFLMIKDGKINREIAEELHLSQLTVESHRKKINSKLGVSSALELVKKAMEMNI
ncbi:response regulator containing a CheY-like receiver domain and an HTH DNA-binding domain [Belliella baltica DSM 15883]|uniref:Response regulator containing a CheY-like receiver domain and an HTH DNA-binding domain n=1 Tax=Belliella baltica (strain DSM 15883 / CIP 108006 / LMG 21964 / BA134) TaxID=866536 RepID=I3Z228_BELBD|nr:response regulator transcription factor [Belliella baltica]AFL83296.1 response regulator containing a CheY-like receiver domain and an HTH DNA-binding domain [Belliella baltica DSM 15883]